MNVYTQGGKKLELSFLGKGGEGSVYSISGYPNRVAKIYHNETREERRNREEKIKAMIAINQSLAFRNARLSDGIAWPLSALYDQSNNFVGFGMKKIKAATELDDLYAYPPNNSTVSVKDRVTVLISICDVIDRLHKIGQVFGDFNPNNIKILPDMSVNFVDADSYHITSSGIVYRCVVCASGYVAPELISKCKGYTYADCPGTTFTKETDRFALAIHIFRMLMNGCHPYICERQLKRVGSAPAPKSKDKRVEHGETPFFRSIPNYIAPQYAPDINSLPPYLLSLFRKAFVDGHSDPKVRPTASEWKEVLIRYSHELVKCQNNPLHYHWKEIASCPYCSADTRFSQSLSLVPSMKHSSTTSNNTHVPNTTLKSQQAPQSTTSTNSISFQRSISRLQQPTSLSVAKPSPPAPNKNTYWFWTITLILSLSLLIFGAVHILPGIYSEVFGDDTLAEIGVIGSLISGVVGTILFNNRWTPGRLRGSYSWWEYLLSLLSAFGFAIGFGIAEIVIIISFYVLLIALGFVLAKKILFGD